MKVNEGIEVNLPDNAGHFTTLICQKCGIKRLVDSRFFEVEFITTTQLPIPDANYCDSCLQKNKK